jgi:hypothetical protein
VVWPGGGGQGGPAMGVVVVGLYWGAVGKIKIAEELRIQSRVV